ncbi:hypothetical protein H0H81_011015 [Sphagnurus paluster]|uniref:XPG-I domain-containing protein n=1 Tax=Sphagnurus paluster TaxID=117069 RepID=A0A9P7FNQ8_9AGAR|nr:hypothetical protein H0H81_011015 [Sphagnurus paluster]
MSSSPTTASTDVHSGKLSATMSSSPPKSYTPRLCPNIATSNTTTTNLKNPTVQSRPLAEIIDETFQPFDHQTKIVAPFNNEMNRDLAFERELSSMILDTILETHAWASTRPKQESSLAAQNIEQKIVSVMETEKEQGMSSSHPRPSLFFCVGIHCDSDGTLITQRFHFAQAPHPHRHVLGWYKLARELKEAGVSAVCVFDGKDRNIAKAREVCLTILRKFLTALNNAFQQVERRREVRRKTAARGALEQDRSKRLHDLSKLLHRLAELDEATQEWTVSLLRELPVDARLNDSTATIPNFFPTTPPHTLPYTFRAMRGPRLPPDDEFLTSQYIANKILESTLEDGRLSLFSAAHDAPYYDLEPNLSLLEDVSNDVPQDHPWFQDVGPPDPIHFPDMEHDVITHDSPFHIDELDHPSLLPSEPTLPTLSDVRNQLANLYVEFRQSISKFATLATPLDPPLPSAPGVGDPETQAEVVMTKAQYQLMLEEGNFWDKLLAPHGVDEATASEAALAKLSHTSDVMSASFERRMNPPTRQTYSECMEILDVMGIPCLKSSGAFEAEALAASMVLNGQADYVASEDTDVLVYEAPLVRNLTNRNVPLALVSGTEIRRALDLDRRSFIDFALLLGTDFSQRIKNVGPARALKFIREHGSIEGVIESEKSYLPRLPRTAYLAQVEVARRIFQTLPPAPQDSLLVQGAVDEERVTDVLTRFGLGRHLVDISEWDSSAALKGNYFNDSPGVV